MAATPKPVRKEAKKIKTEMRKHRAKADTTYGIAKARAENKQNKKRPLSSLRGPAEFRLKAK